MLLTGSNRAANTSGGPMLAPSPGGVKSLRTRWNRRLAVLLAILVVAAAASFATTQHMVRGFRDTAQRIEADAALSAELRADIATHTNLGHSLIERDDDDKGRRLATLEASVRANFDQAAGRARGDTTSGLLRQAQDRWEQGTAAIRHGRTGADRRIEAHVSLAEASEEAAVLIDEAGTAGQATSRAELVRADSFTRYAMAAMLLLVMLVVALLVRLGRQLTVEVLRPVTRLRDSADRLAAGNFDHRAEVDRTDELGELAVSFNTMADAIAHTHRDLTRQANHDALTGLANRAAFHARLDAALSGPQRRAGTQAVVFVDLDDFKDVNDTLGHGAGDELLTVVAARLAEAVRPGDLVARLGGDEFAILLETVVDQGSALAVADRAVAALTRPISIAGSTVQVSASAGLAMRGELTDPDELMRCADVAMYLAKGRGKNRVERYDRVLDEAAAERNELKIDVMGAAGRGELVVDYQPIVDLATGTVVALEALVRWQHPTRGLLPPSAFIDLAEDTGAIIDIGACVLDTAVHQLRAWQDAHGMGELTVSVNVSGGQLNTPGFADHVETTLRHAGLDPAHLVLEVTESVLADPAGPAATTLARLRQQGVRIALDDFGTGYSSIGYLRQIPVDILKIDRSFVSGDQSGDQGGDTLLEAIVSLGQRLGLDVIPEGIENSDQLARTRYLGCRNGQGFLLSRPVPPAAIDAILGAPQSLLPPDLARLISTPLPFSPA